MNSLVILLQGVLSTIIVFILLKTTNLGVYAIAGVSSIAAIIRNLVFTFPYAAKCIKQKWYVLYFPALRTAFSVFLVSLVCIVFKQLFEIDTWGELIGFSVVSGTIGLCLNIIIILSKSEKKYLASVVKNKLNYKSLV
jgi:hypothetical protein